MEINIEDATSEDMSVEEFMSEEEARKSNATYFLVLPWHFVDEFKEREKEMLLENGKRFILPAPHFTLI